MRNRWKSHYLNQCWPSSLTHISNARGKWVKLTCIPGLQLCPSMSYKTEEKWCCWIPDSKVHGANMGPTWVLPAPDGPHVGHKNHAIGGTVHFNMRLCCQQTNAWVCQDWDQGVFQKKKCCMKMIYFNVWARYSVWNFKGYLWNSTQNIWLIHWKTWILFTGEKLRALRFKSS